MKSGVEKGDFDRRSDAHVRRSVGSAVLVWKGFGHATLKQ